MMKKLLSLLIVLMTTSIVNAQYSIKGTMTPPEKSDWVMLHRLQGIKPKFISHTTIKFDTIKVGADKQIIGRFSFELPETAQTGVYRATYRNSGSGFVDFLFNKENIEFYFNPKYPEQTIAFTSSRENKVFSKYLEQSANAQKKINSYQVNYIQNPVRDVKKAYKKAVEELEDLQEANENKSEGMLSYHFIKASAQYNSSSPIDNMQKYVASKVDNFFKYVDFESMPLYQSSFLIDRINDFVFYLNYSEDQVTQQSLYKESITKVLDDVLSNKSFKKEAIEFLITSFTDKRNSEIVDWLFTEFYDKLDNRDQSFKDKKLGQLSVSVGRIAPDFSWKENETEYKLSTLNDGKYYLLIFWSTACPHCVKEIPDVHNFMKQFTNTSVIGFGIESNDTKFNEFKKQLDGWHNVYGTHPENKFDNETVRAYKIDATPTYFVLDSNKKIIAIPNTVEDVHKYFNNL
ncbi:TlpA family protein disulfide reductase [Tenacibaculum sp. nBUS_03]|uniref:TlpA family protein disulfide reductase n=1 Tax=Tenacibaculum sp. nBUS_03 TaxID=3395320 RepID=UPI003EBB0F41